MGVARLLLPRFINAACSSRLSRISRLFSTSAAMIRRPWIYDLGELEESIGESAVYQRALKFQRPTTVKFQKNMLNSVSLIGLISAPFKNYDTASGRTGVYTSLTVDSSARAYRNFTVTLNFWDELAEIAVEHLKLRDLIYVSGSLVSYEGMDECGKSIIRHKVRVAEVNYIIQHAAGPSCQNSLKLEPKEQPLIVYFRWSPSESWGATWQFLFTSISTYIIMAATLHLLLRLFRCRHPVPLGPFPAFHSLALALLSAIIFTGILLSSIAEIRDTRWFWRRSKTPFQWLLCFPLGTRPSGRVFFWSYIFYLSRFLHILKTFFTILRNPLSFPYFQLFNHSILIVMTFLWLEFTQSFQVLAILSMTLMFSLVYGYRFCTEIGLQKSYFPFLMFCQIVLVATNLAWHIGVLVLHFWKGGCNGMGAWVFNSVLNSFVLLSVLDFYVRKCMCIERDFAVFRVETKPLTLGTKTNNTLCFSPRT